jgi:ankyrin repeat protein
MRGGKPERLLEEVLQSTSGVLFPAELGERTVELSSRSIEGDTPLHVLAWRNDVSGTEVLIAAGANVNDTGDMGETPLHIAIRQQNLALIRVLLQAGARTDIRSEFEETPAEMAKQVGGEIANVLSGNDGGFR